MRTLTPQQHALKAHLGLYTPQQMDLAKHLGLPWALQVEKPTVLEWHINATPFDPTIRCPETLGPAYHPQCPIIP